MFENVDGRRTDDGRTTDAGVTGILIAHLGAFGSGELKTQSVLRMTCQAIFIPKHSRTKIGHFYSQPQVQNVHCWHSPVIVEIGVYIFRVLP